MLGSKTLETERLILRSFSMKKKRLWEILIDNKVVGKYTINCTLDTEEYLYEVEYNKNYLALNIGGDAFIANHIDLINIMMQIK